MVDILRFCLEGEVALASPEDVGWKHWNKSI